MRAPRLRPSRVWRGGLGRDPFRVGLAALVATVLLGVLISVLSNVQLGKSGYVAHLEHTAGLRVSESVQVAGVDSGEVTGIAVEGDKVVVDFTVDNDIRLGRDTQAAVKVSTLLGTHYLDVDPIGPGELEDGVVPLSQTSVPFNLQDVIDKGTEAADRLDSALLGQALSEVAETLRAAGPEFLPALEGVDRISRVVSERTDQLGELLDSSRAVADQLAASSDDLITLMRRTNLVAAELTARRQQIRRLLRDVASLSATVRTLIRETDADFGPAMDNLQGLLEVLRAKDKELRTSLHNLAVASRYLANATGNGPWVELLIPDTDDSTHCAEGGEGCQ
jgi:phospholipid/cholesterol/gamma-HCH transport system substrate-binding protein